MMYVRYTRVPALTKEQAKDLALCGEAAKRLIASDDEAKRIAKEKKEAEEAAFFSAGFEELKKRFPKPQSE